jgi:hypothetical protein
MGILLIKSDLYDQLLGTPPKSPLKSPNLLKTQPATIALQTILTMYLFIHMISYRSMVQAL